MVDGLYFSNDRYSQYRTNTHIFLSVDLESIGHVERQTTAIPGQCVSVLLLVYGYLASMCESVP